MLDRDPNADQPPDPSLSRPRSRSHKPKNASKKQPQRGLGVAQLEKLRLEEQSKQQEAACLASLQQQNLHHQSHYIHFQQLDQQTPCFHYQHQNLLQQQHQNQNSPICLPLQIKHMELSYQKSSFAEPRFALPSVKLNVVQNSLFPLATLANRDENRPLPLLIPQHQLLAEDEVSTSPMSQVHDLCSPATTHVRPSSAESRLSPLLTRASSTSLLEKSWLNHLYDRDPNPDKEDHLSFARCHDNGTKMQGQVHSVPDDVNASITNFHRESGSLHIPMGKLLMQSDGCTAPITDSFLRSRPDGAFDAYMSPTVPLEFPPVGIASGGIQMKELSSFQNMSLCSIWSPVDKAFNRKRSWACTQELSRSAEVFKGMDLNTSVDEMESELIEQDNNVTLPFTIRSDWNCLTAEKFGESKSKGLVSDKAFSQCDSIKLERPLSDTCASGAAFLSLRKQSINSRKWEVETPGDFLTLGPSSSLVPKTRNTSLGSGNCSTYPILQSQEKIASPWYSQQNILEQVKNSCFSSATANNDAMSLEYQPSYLHNPLQRKVGFSDFFACNKVEALLQDGNTDESLDLELRLSI